MDKYTLGIGLAWYLIFVFSTVLHEAAHALAAWKLGDPTSYHGGQVTLNPAPHIRREPFGMVLVPVVSFIAGGWMIGWASTPYDPYWAQQYPRRSAMMSLAGPMGNLFLVIVAFAAIRIGTAAGAFYAPESISGFHEVVAAHHEGVGHVLATVLGIMFMLNLVLLFFNLLPLPPLDGSGVLMLLMSRETANRYQNFLHQPMFMVIGLVVAWRFFGEIIIPIRMLALNLLYPGVHYG